MNKKSVLKIIIIVIVSVGLVGLATFVFVNRKAFVEQVTFDEVDGFERYERIMDEWRDEPNRIEIPKLGVIAKITEPKDKSEMERLLLESVTYYMGSVKPGEDGNVIITGHSSAPTESEYSHIFATLNKLRFGDKVLVYREGIEYRYEVKEKDYVKTDEISVLSQERDGLTLITCWPIGTDLNRLTIFAEMPQLDI